jgi:hypothetical protein
VWNLLHQDGEICFFHNRQNEVKEFFSKENYVEFCNNICCVMEALGQLAFFLSTQKLSLNDVLVQNGNKFESVNQPMPLT